MMGRWLLRSSCAALCALGLGGPAFAALPAAFGSISVDASTQINGVNAHDGSFKSTTHDTLFATLPLSSSKATANLFFPFVTATATTVTLSPGVNNEGSFSDATLWYFLYFQSATTHSFNFTMTDELDTFDVVGPGNEFEGQFGLAASSALVSLRSVCFCSTDPTPDIVHDSVSYFSNFAGPVSVQNLHEEFHHLTLSTNTFYEVEIDAEASSENGSSASAGADPMFDFSRTDYPDITMLLSAGVGNSTGAFAPPAAGVPEPVTWLLMLGGFGAVGAVMRSRRSLLN